MSAFEFAAGIYREDKEPERQRVAAHLWLSEAIDRAMKDEEPVGPAMGLLSALEGLDLGTVAPMLRLPDNVKAGGKEGDPGEIAMNGFALAAIDGLIQTGLSAGFSVALVADDFRIRPEALANLRKKMNSERAKPEAARRRYLWLISAYESDMAEMSELLKKDDARPRIYWMIAKVSESFGRS
jgi:uncharacterized protein YoaH (UPF0181 family)